MDTPLFGALVLWGNKATVDFNDVKDSDYTLVKCAQFPRADGEPIEGLPEGYEWLANCSGDTPPDYDPRLFVLNSDTRPTNIPHPEWPNYNQYRTQTSLTKRTNEEIISSIRQEEALANSSLVTEGETTKLSYLAMNATIRKVAGMQLSETDTNAIARHAEVSEKMLRNAANAELLINKVTANENVDLSSGWEYDNISVGGYPFAN